MKLKNGGAGREEAFRVIHAATINAIHDEWSRKGPRNARAMYERVKGLVHKMVIDRREKAPNAFRDRWESAGLAEARGRHTVIMLWEKTINSSTISWKF